MHLIRRQALRATSSPSSIFSQTRSISTSSPFVVRSKVQSSICNAAFRRFNSNDAFGSADGESGYGGSNRGERQPRPYGGDRGGRGGDGFKRAYGGDRGGDTGGREMRSGFRDNTRPVRPPPTPNPSLYVGNLMFDITAEDLTRDFTPYGTIKSAIIASDARGMSKGFGYIQFETTEQATAAIEGKHQTVMEGRRLVVNYQVQRQSPAGSGSINTPSETLFIGNLAFEMSDADLNKLFREIRNVTDVRVAIDRRTGQPRGFAHADFIDVESAIQGKEILAGKEVYGRALRVDFSASHSNSNSRSSSPSSSLSSSPSPSESSESE